MSMRNVIIPMVAAVLLTLAVAEAQDQPKDKGIALYVLVESYVHNAFHGDTEIGPIYYDTSTLLIQAPKEQAGRRLELRHRHLAAFTMTNIVLHVLVKQSALEGTDRRVQLDEDDIIGKIRRIEPSAGGAGEPAPQP